MRPVCVKCGKEMIPARNEVAVWHPCEPEVPQEDRIDFVVSGDRWECEVCGVSIVTGFGAPFIAGQHSQEFLHKVRDEAPEKIKILRMEK